MWQIRRSRVLCRNVFQLSEGYGGYVSVVEGDVVSACGGRLLVHPKFVDMQAVDLKLLDPEVPDDGPPDRQPANRQGADGYSPQGRCPDRGRPGASRARLVNWTFSCGAAEA